MICVFSTASFPHTRNRICDLFRPCLSSPRCVMRLQSAQRRRTSQSRPRSYRACSCWDRSPSCASLRTVASGALQVWPLHEILSLWGFWARINHFVITPPHLHCPHYCNTIGRLLRNIPPPLLPLFDAVYHTILVVAISCKDQIAGALLTAASSSIRVLLLRVDSVAELREFADSRKWPTNTATISFFTVPLRKIPWSIVPGSNRNFCHSAACDGRIFSIVPG